MFYAVEVNVSQAKRVGATGNLYIVEGLDTPHIFADKANPQAIQCDITTREGATWSHHCGPCNTYFQN